LEAGEGTWGQLVRHFGWEAVRHVVRDLKCVFISHIHGDHHIGLAKILSMRRSVSSFCHDDLTLFLCGLRQLNVALTEPLYLITHRPVLMYLRELHEIEDLGFDDPSSNGVIPVLSDVLHWKQTGVWQNRDVNKVALPWLNVEA
jgi:ribonuclease Z